jgi:hypothetical protein
MFWGKVVVISKVVWYFGCVKQPNQREWNENMFIYDDYQKSKLIRVEQSREVFFGTHPQVEEVLRTTRGIAYVI